MSDLIDRQAAIDVIDEIEAEVADGYGYQYAKWREYFCDLPPAQLGANLAEVGTDCISRQAAIDAVKDRYYKYGRSAKVEELAWAIEALPSAQPKSYREGYQAGFKDAQPERMRGTWIIKDNPGTGWYRVTCSECGEDVTSTAPCIGFYPNAKVTWDYCPNCGADMREVDDE